MTSILQSKKVHQDLINEFRSLITLCLSNNLCVFKGKKYRFPDGLPMGGPLSSLVADVFMDDLESSVLDSHPNSSSVRFWTRYVDDVLCMWRGSVSELQKFHDYLNNFHPSVSFTVEVGGSKISYLDLTIAFVESDNVLRVSNEY